MKRFRKNCKETGYSVLMIFPTGFKPAIEDVVLRDALPPFAFGHLIGTNLNQWRSDLHEIYDHLLTALNIHSELELQIASSFGTTVDEDE